MPTAIGHSAELQAQYDAEDALADIKLDKLEKEISDEMRSWHDELESTHQKAIVAMTCLPEKTQAAIGAWFKVLVDLAQIGVLTQEWCDNRLREADTVATEHILGQLTQTILERKT